MKLSSWLVYTLFFLGVLFVAQQPSTSSASVFLPQAHELSNSSPKLKDLQRKFVASLLAKTPHADHYEIDDMWFRIDPLAQNDGFSGNLWTGSVVYYTFDAAVTEQNRSRWLDAAAEWADVSDLKFVARTHQQNYIHVQNDLQNASYIGMVGGMQEMLIANWNSKYIIVHEIGHALGLSHEHSRSNRDEYVNVFFDRIVIGKEHNFKIHNTVSFGPYDFDSLLHYSKNAFSVNSDRFNTIEPRRRFRRYLNKMGQRNHLSVLDKAGIGERYGNKSLPIADRYEPGDNHARRATMLGACVKQIHTIAPINDTDWFRIKLKQKSDLVVATAGLRGDTRMWLYNSKLREIGFDDDSGKNLFSRISKKGLSAGTYYAKIDEFMSNDMVKNYSMVAKYSECDDDLLLLILPAILSSSNKRRN